MCANVHMCMRWHISGISIFLHAFDHAAHIIYVDQKRFVHMSILSKNVST